MSLNKWMELVDVVLPNITTDLSKDDIYSYLLAIVKMATTEVHQFSLPIDGGYTSQSINGQQCLVPDIAKNKSSLNQFIFKK